MEVVTCSAQATAQLTAEVSDYDAQVCNGNTHQLLFLSFMCFINLSFILQFCRFQRLKSSIISVIYKLSLTSFM